jgi:Zn-dependent protease/CBS domain-containing protein
VPGSILVARLFGIDIRIHLSWFIIFGLILLTLSGQVLPDIRPNWSDEKTLIVAAITALLFFTSILAHELAHSLVARRFGMAVSSITLFLLGGVSNLAKEPPSARAEFLMAAAGPFTSFVIGGIALGLQILIEGRLSLIGALDPVGVVAGYLGWINLSLGAFNLVPGFPLDGGRVLRSIVWAIRKDRAVATRIAARGGQIVAVLLFGFGAYSLFQKENFGGIWLALIAYFLYNAASASMVQERVVGALGGVKVGSLMRADQHMASSGMSIGRLVREIVMPYNQRAVPVQRGDQVVGLVTIGDLRKVDQAQWDATAVDQVMTGTDGLATVTPDDTLVTALDRFGASEHPVLLVLARSSLVGVLDRETVAGYIRMRESLGLR